MGFFLYKGVFYNGEREENLKGMLCAENYVEAMEVLEERYVDSECCIIKLDLLEQITNDEIVELDEIAFAAMIKVGENYIW